MSKIVVITSGSKVTHYADSTKTDDRGYYTVLNCGSGSNFSAKHSLFKQARDIYGQIITEATCKKCLKASA